MPAQFPPLTPTVRTLIVVLVVFFVGQTAAEGLLGIPLMEWAALSPGVHVELAWQWATYWLVAIIAQPQDVVWHLVSIFVVYWSLATFEMERGPSWLRGLMLAGVLGGAIPTMLLGALLPSLFGAVGGPSVLFFAWLGAFAMLQRGAKMGLWLVGLPPVSAWTMVGIMIALSALQAAWVHNVSGLVSSVGAIGGGIVFARLVSAPKRTAKPSAAPIKRAAGRPNLKVIEGGREGSRDDDDNKPRWLN
jgi:hypothetical protein